MTVEFERKALFDAVRAIKGGALTQADVDAVNAVLDAKGTSLRDPEWIATARSLIGQKEIPGPQHNGWIAKGWARLGAAWFNDDETPWCGFFIAHCMDAAGLPYPAKGEFARAAAWRSYGVGLLAAVVGAIGVKARAGGNHVFFIVGQTPDKQFYKALGGNQGNMVSIMDIAKKDVDAIRWPAGVPAPVSPLPILPAGTISRNEA